MPGHIGFGPSVSGLLVQRLSGKSLTMQSQNQPDSLMPDREARAKLVSHADTMRKLTMSTEEYRESQRKQLEQSTQALSQQNAVVADLQNQLVDLGDAFGSSFGIGSGKIARVAAELEIAKQRLKEFQEASWRSTTSNRGRRSGRR